MTTTGSLAVAQDQARLGVDARTAARNQHNSPVKPVRHQPSLYKKLFPQSGEKARDQRPRD
jgi:hypothetical protein